MREVMLDLVNLAVESARRGTLAAKKLATSRARSPVLAAARAPGARSGRWRQSSAILPTEIGAAVLIDRDVVDVGERDAGLAQTIAIACEGNPAQCLTRRKRSSSAAATSSPSRMSAADESP